ncbi:MAG TPA: fluoride efflux transporter CrcB [Bacteroidales bacterium]|nr:fluoride efflux transporter CrcB [Bacteroidales bacterium]
MFKTLILIGTGSFLGGVSRFVATRYLQEVFVSSFPYGTFFVNIFGCFLIGLILGISDKYEVMGADTRLFLTVGFCGGFTTFSSFASEKLELLRNGEIVQFALYAGLSVVLGIIAVYLGNLVVKVVLP